ncbi:MAG: hypothetical protein DI535_09405 [Citrobacter freundii]|nr:MAG: hypothetical protein DI535_09405 [Citrobacter freundii]
MKTRNSSLYFLLVAGGCTFSHLRVAGQMVLGLNKDSLKKVIRQLKEDTVKVNNFITLGQQYENNIPDSAVYYYQEAGQLARKLNYASGVVRYVNNYTAVLNVQGKFDESLKLHEEALAITEKNHLPELRVKTLMNIGVVYQLKGDYKAAADHYLKNLPALEQTAPQETLSLLYCNLSSLYRTLNQPQKTLEFAKKSVAAAGKSKEPYTIGRAYHCMANALQNAGKDKEREQYLHRAYDIGKQLDDIDLQETALINLGDLLNISAPPGQAIPFFKQALPLADSLNDVYGKSLILQGMGHALFRNKQFKEAELTATETLRFSRETDQRETETKALLLLSDIKIALNQLDSSIFYRNRYDSVYGSLINKDLVKNIQELETQYQVQKKQSELLKQQLLLEQKNRETARQRTWLWLLIAGLTMMAILLFWGIRYYRQRRLLDQKNLEALKAGQENLRLKSVMEGQLLERQRISQEMHDDMGSGLTSMLFLSRTIQGQDNVVSRIKQTAQDLIQKMNEIIWIMNHEQDTLDRLVAYMRIHIAESLDNAGIDYSFTATDPLPAMPLNQEYRRNIYLCSKEAVHNCIKHAGATKVEIMVNITDHLEVIIKDNGRGITGNKNSAGNGLGNMKRRMEQAGGVFTIQSGEQGTTVILNAPLPV